MTFEFKAKLWEYKGKGAWHFITVPKDISSDIYDLSSGRTNGFGSVRVEISIGNSSWKTSIFPNKAEKTFMFPVKKIIRDAEKLSLGDQVQVSMRILL